MANIAGIPVYKEIGATPAPAVPQDRAPVVIVAPARSGWRWRWTWAGAAMP